MPQDPRNYGLGESTQYVRGVPRVMGESTGGCPYCGCAKTFRVEIEVRHPMLRGQHGVGSYIGCAACPWASPMMMRSLRVEGG